MHSIAKSALALGTTIAASSAANAIRHFSAEDALAMVGLARRHGSLERTLSAIGLVAVGAAVGAGVALVLAPTSGEKLRARIAEGLDDAKDRLQDATSSVTHMGSSSSSNRSTAHS
jgi:hypothetical protein